MQRRESSFMERYGRIMGPVEDYNRRVWGDKVVLATMAHAMGGLGLGLLLDRRTVARFRGLAFGLLAFSIGAHVYAFLTMREGTPTVRRFAREAEEFGGRVEGQS